MESIKNTVSNLVGSVGSIGYGGNDASTERTQNSVTDTSTENTSSTNGTAHYQTTTGTDHTTPHASTDTPAATGGDKSLDSGTTRASDTIGGTTGLDRDNKPDEIALPRKDESPSSHHHDPTQVQSPQQGPDPALVGDAKAHPKMTGAGVPGSHSAVFGLTPDGKTHDDTTHGVTPVKPAHSTETAMGRKSVVGGGISGGTGGVSDQIDRPDQTNKGLERRDPAPEAAAGSGGKPGAGLTGLQQGSGNIS